MCFCLLLYVNYNIIILSCFFTLHFHETINLPASFLFVLLRLKTKLPKPSLCSCWLRFFLLPWITIANSLQHTHLTANKNNKLTKANTKSFMCVSVWKLIMYAVKKTLTRQHHRYTVPCSQFIWMMHACKSMVYFLRKCKREK